MSHIFKNPFLCIPQQSQLHSVWTQSLSGPEVTGTTLLHKAQARYYEDPDKGRRLGPAVSLNVTEHGPGIFSVPVFHPQFCSDLLAEAALFDYKVNEIEEPDYQIPEVVLSRYAPQLYGALAVHAKRIMFPLTDLLYGVSLDSIVSIQLAKYRDTGTSHGNWHVDEDSTITFVIALNDDHEGGGTEVRLMGLSGKTITVPQLPVGYAMVFPGKVMQHRGLRVEKGTRNLLVFWME